MSVITCQTHFHEIWTYNSVVRLPFEDASLLETVDYVVLIERHVVFDVLKWTCVFSLFLSSHFMFNMGYASRVSATLEFIQRLVQCFIYFMLYVESLSSTTSLCATHQFDSTWKFQMLPKLMVFKPPDVMETIYYENNQYINLQIWWLNMWKNCAKHVSTIVISDFTI